MKPAPPTILLPCYGLDDFPTHLPGDEAQSLLTAWSVGWHPAALAACGAIPEWFPAAEPPEACAGRLFLVPSASRLSLPDGWLDTAAQAGAQVLLSPMDRRETARTLLRSLDVSGTKISERWAGDFWALAYCYLQVELLTRQMRYTSGVDELRLADEAIIAAQAVAAGNDSAARDGLTCCFDMLSQARDQFYPVDSYLIDLTLVAATTLDAGLQRELQAEWPANLMLSGKVLAQWAAEQPAMVEKLRDELAAGRLAIVGGEWDEQALPLLSREQIYARFHQGLAAFEQHLGQTPGVYGRRRFGLSPVLPQLLSGFGFRAALHVTLDDGMFPEGEQAKGVWESHDGSRVEMLARVPVRAARSETFLQLAHTLGHTMDADHVAAVVFAHWPDQTHEAYEDLRRAAAYSSALGRFVTLDEFFELTEVHDLATRFEADEYRSPYLRQAVDQQAVDPISRYVEHAAQDVCRQRQAALRLMGASVTPDLAAQKANDDAWGNMVANFSRALARHDVPEANGYLVVNPLPHAARLGVDLPRLAAPPAVDETVRLATDAGESPQAVLEVPPLGFAWVGPRETSEPHGERAVVMAEADRLRNEYFEVEVDVSTGAIRAVRVHGRRGNRLGQQLVLRTPGAQQHAEHGANAQSVMAADTVEVTACTGVYGEITSHGRLLDRNGNRLADFVQRFGLWRGSRVLELNIRIEPRVDLGMDPWQNYFAHRLAWPDPSAILWRDLAGSVHPTLEDRFTAPRIVEVRAGRQQVCLLTGGLAFQRRAGQRMLDTLLVVRGEQAREFRLGIGVDVPHPLSTAEGWRLPVAEQVCWSAPPAGSHTAWMFRVDGPSVLATHWAPAIDQGRLVGFETRLLETEGRPAQAVLRAPWPLGQASVCDYRGRKTGELSIEDGAAVVPIAPHGWLQIEARFENQG